MMNLMDAGGVLVNPARLEGYDGAKVTRNRKTPARSQSRSQDEDRLIGKYDRDTLRLNCLHLRRNNAVAAGVCERLADNIVGPEGIMPQAKTTDNDWNDAAEQYWREWCKKCDFRGMFSMRELQRLSVQSRLHSGEMLFVLTSNGQLQAIEPDRVATPNDKQKDEDVIDGIRIANGRRAEYYVCNRDRNGYVDTKTAQGVDARNVVQLFRPIRIYQLRGIPDFSPVINTLSDHGDLTEAILGSARLNAKRSAFVTTDVSMKQAVGPRNVTARNDDVGQIYEGFSDGILTYYGKPGQDVKLLSSDSPGSNYIAHNEFLLKLIGAALSIPYQFLMLDFSSGSFGSNRAALMQTYRTFENWQSWMVDSFLQRVWNWRIAKAIKDGELDPAPIDERGYSQWYRVVWTPPEYSWIDPQKEAAANLAEFKLGTSSITSFARKRGRDGEDVLAEKARDIASAMRIAAEISKETGQPMNWRDLIDVAQPGQTAPSMEPKPMEQQQ